MNAFEVLGLEVRPWLEPEAVKEAHLRAMSADHPDAAGHHHHEAALRLNEARDLLANDRTRLRLLVELARGTPMAERGAVPSAIGDLFAPLAETFTRVRSHLQVVEEADTELEKAGLLAPGLELLDDLQQFQDRLRGLRHEQAIRLQSLDAAWMTGEKNIEGLEETALALAFIDRWSDQVDEQVFRLSGTLA